MRAARILFSAVTLLASMSMCAAQEIGDKPVVKMLVPYAPGGFPDTVGRILASQLAADTGQTFIVENRPGGSGAIAAEAVAHATPDGLTLMVADVQQWGIAPKLLANLAYDPIRDFAPVAILCTTGNFFAVGADVATSFEDLIAKVRAHPDTYFYGTPGIGTLHQLTFEALKARLNLKMTHVPYKGGSEVVAAIAGGQIAMTVQAMPSLKGLADQGKLRIFAVTLDKRSKYQPDIPTFEELGVPDFDFPGTLVLFATAGTPPDILARLESNVRKAMLNADVQKRLAAFAIESAGGSSDEFRVLIQSDLKKFGDAIIAGNVKPE